MFVAGSSPGSGLSGPAHPGYHGTDDPRRSKKLLALLAT